MKHDPRPDIEFSSRFNSDRKSTLLSVRISLLEVLDIFYDNPTNKLLKNHSLARNGKRYHGLWSIDVTDDYRAIYRKEGRKIIFIMLRTHEQLYGK